MGLTARDTGAKSEWVGPSGSDSGNLGRATESEPPLLGQPSTLLFMASLRGSAPLGMGSGGLLRAGYWRRGWLPRAGHRR